ncbi:MAG: hypothetical protein ACRBN8_28825 [Nannocystales bacterium]
MAGLEPEARALLREYRQAKRADVDRREAVWSQIEDTLADADVAQGDELTPQHEVGRPIAWTVGVLLAAAVVASVALGMSALVQADRKERSFEAPDVSAPGDTSEVVPGSDAPGRAVGRAGHPSGVAVPAGAPPVRANHTNDRPGPRPTARTRPNVEGEAAQGTERDGLRAEMALVETARQRLRAGQPAEALKAVQQHAVRFPRGQMIEDRRVLRVEALCALGKASQANAEVRMFAEAFPRSAHTTRLRALCPLP